MWQARDQFQTERLSPEPCGTRNSPCGVQVQNCLLLGAGTGPSQGHLASISPREQDSRTTQPFSLSPCLSLSLSHTVSIPSWKTLSHSRFDGRGFGRLHQYLILENLSENPFLTDLLISHWLAPSGKTALPMSFLVLSGES